ncbi:hypothetical protein [Shewanella woodyi]|uniref:hypothetical protein n=1 Tax=Shewanella woodyi TaxID=60961 RepID=UPI00374958D3
MNMQEKRYPYKPKKWLGPVIFVMFLGMSYPLALMAYNKETGIDFFNIVTLPAEYAAIIFGLFSVFFIILSLLGILIFKASLASDRYIVLSEEGIQAPKTGISNQIKCVSWEKIEYISLQQVSSQVFFQVHHDQGKLTINSTLFPQYQDFEEAVNFITEHLSIDPSSPA